MRSLRNALGFFTIMPLSGTGTLEEAARAGWLLPLVGVLVGGVTGLIGMGSVRVVGQPAAAAIMLAAALLLTGLHHTDGLADLGDALMVHGNSARRIEVLKDRTLGVGAAGALILTYLITWGALLQLLTLSAEGWQLFWALSVIGVSARLSLQTLAVVSKPSHQGSGAVFLKAMKGWRGAAGFCLSIATLTALSSLYSPRGTLAAAGAAVIIGLAIAIMGRRCFGGAGGDLLGAAVELGRLGALLALVAVLLHAGS